MRLKDKVGIVTGGGSGIGCAIAEHFAREGAHVVVVELNAERGQAVVDGILRSQGTAIFVQADVSNASQVKNAIDRAVEQYGALDILCNNAAIQLIGQDARAHEVSEEVWDLTLNINLRSVWLCCKYAIPYMLERGGSIINIASPTGLYGIGAGFTAYSTSKAGIFGLTRVMAVDYGSNQIRVNAIVPGTTQTPLIATLLANQQHVSNLLSRTPLGRFGTPEDEAGLAVFLASDESSYCTGGYYMADGGLTAV
ncbi:MAG TPA: SDR family NAD(P)-dependent oxidoreductase [Anaerolineae bacterium]|nr:SDR family NAD(P)-dependent oxidoreductase [Anaerolineae bacterium]